MKTLVIDTSVFVKWLNQDSEKDLENVDKILQEVKSGQVELIAPELLKYEIGNVLLKGKQLTLPQAYIAFGTAYSIPINFIVESEKLAKETYKLAYDLEITYYDAAFISLAQEYDAILVTDNIKHQGKTKKVEAICLKDY